MTTLKGIEEKVARWVAEGGPGKPRAEHTPNPDGTCKGCGDTVVRKVTGLFRGHILTSHPECQKCGRMYLYAKDAPTVGAQ